jgi:hypothetical protein
VSLSLQFLFRLGIPVCFSIKGKVHPYQTTNRTGNHQNTYQQSSSLFDTSVTEDDANDKPLPMRISVANLIDQEGCFVTLNGGKSRPSAVKIIKEALRLCSAQTCKQNLVNQVVQANPLAPSLLDSQAMRGNPIIIA